MQELRNRRSPSENMHEAIGVRCKLIFNIHVLWFADRNLLVCCTTNCSLHAYLHLDDIHSCMMKKDYVVSAVRPCSMTM